MGHIRLGDLPRTRAWDQVVALIRAGADAEQIANATIRAAERGLSQAPKDHGLVETVWLLTQLPQAARSDDFHQGLGGCQVTVSAQPGLMEIVSAVTGAVDRRLANNCGRTDLGEMAQMAAAESILAVVGERAHSLFGTSPEEVRADFARLGTVKQFGVFARQFFARLTYKCLDYFLSRVLANHVGEGQRFITLAQQTDFCQALETHCHEAARIVEVFAGQWTSKTNWENGRIARNDAVRFTGGAMQKLIRELKRGAQLDDR